MRHLNVTYASVETLKPYARNARAHTKKQIRQIADSIETFGFTKRSGDLSPDRTGRASHRRG